MRKTLVIGDKNIEMEANGATAFRFKKIFAPLDLFKQFVTAPETPDEVAAQMEVSQMLAFVMAKQAEGVDMNKLNEDKFIEWLEQFDGGDLLEVLDEVVEVWQSSKKTTSKPKK